MMLPFGPPRPRTAPDSRTKSQPRRFRPAMLKLDERIMPAVTFHGGPVLAHVDVRNVFFGQSWNAGDPSGTSRAALNQFQSDITTSPYMAMLGEYGVGRGKFGGSDNVTGAGSPMPGSTVSESQIQGMLSTEIRAGRLPEETGQQLYFVYLGPNVKSQTDVNQGALGHHGSFQMFVLHGLFLVAETVTYAVVDNPIGSTRFPAGLSTFQGQTAVSSHELAEAATDPDVRLDGAGNAVGGSTAWWDSDLYNVRVAGGIPLITPNPNYRMEIGDITANQDVTFNANGRSYTVQKEWSNYYGQGIIANGNQSWKLDLPTYPPIFFNYLKYKTWNNGGRSTNYYYATGTDGRTYQNFVTAAGDLGGWFTINA